MNKHNGHYPKDTWLNPKEKIVYLEHAKKIKRSIKRWAKLAKKEGKAFYSKHTICIV